MTPDKNTVWITGASSGIGEALARKFSEKGANIILTSRRRKELERVSGSCKGSGEKMVLPADITDSASLEKAVRQVLERFGHVDLLINNAGVTQRSLCTDTSLDVYRSIMEVDFFGAVTLTRLILPYMIERGSGHIAVTSSVAGKYGTPYRSGYSAAKHALHGFYDSLHAEVHRHNIAVSVIIAGQIQTDISINALTGNGTPYGVMDPGQESGIPVEIAADMIIRGLERKKHEIIVAKGKSRLGLFLKRFLPGVLARKMAREPESVL